MIGAPSLRVVVATVFLGACAGEAEVGPCEDGTRRCDGDLVQLCSDGNWSEPWACAPLEGGLADVPTTCQGGECRP